MQRPGLYFPYVHIRDDQWLKSAALYWPSVHRLVPSGYAKHDSPAARVFSDAHVLRDEAPEGLLASLSWDLAEALPPKAEILVRDFGIERAIAEWHRNKRPWAEAAGQEWDEPALGWIHVTKFPPNLSDYLSSVGLARKGRRATSWEHHGPPEEWIGLHPALAGAYMTALAGRLSELAAFEPLTDQTDLRAATPNSDVGAALQLLLGRTDTVAGAERIRVTDTETYVMLALQHVRPANLRSVPAEKILECREKLSEELGTFREYVASQQSELVQLATLPVERRRLEAFADHVEQSIEQPLRKLEKGLTLHKLEPARSLLLAGSVAPPAAIAATLSAANANPAVVAASGAVAAIGGAWWQLGSVRGAAKAASPVGYLLDVRDELTPKTLAARVRKVLRGTYG